MMVKEEIARDAHRMWLRKEFKITEQKKPAWDPDIRFWNNMIEGTILRLESGQVDALKRSRLRKALDAYEDTPEPPHAA